MAYYAGGGSAGGAPCHFARVLLHGVRPALRPRTVNGWQCEARAFPRAPWGLPPLRKLLYTCEGAALRPCAPFVPPVRSPPRGGAGGWGLSRTTEGEGGSVERARVRGRGAAQRAPAQRVGGSLGGETTHAPAAQCAERAAECSTWNKRALRGAVRRGSALLDKVSFFCETVC